MATCLTHLHYSVTDYLKVIAYTACQKAYLTWDNPRHTAKEREHLKGLATGFFAVHCFDGPKGKQRPRMATITSESTVLAWALRNYGNWILQGRPATWSTEASDALRMADLVDQGVFFAIPA
ncbi:hypothetical protein LBMAG41_13310 [Cyanobium sp.]|nr:hypothetical protein LBMAG41_13310 [Cyanobium sp.]